MPCMSAVALQCPYQHLQTTQVVQIRQALILGHTHHLSTTNVLQDCCLRQHLAMLAVDIARSD